MRFSDITQDTLSLSVKMKLPNGQKHFEVFLKSSFHFSLFILLALFFIIQRVFFFFLFFLMSQEGVCELQRGLSFNFVLGVGVAWRLFFNRDVINGDL